MLKKFLKARKKELMCIGMWALFLSVWVLLPVNVYANDALDELKTQMGTLKELLAAAVSTIGSCVLMWSISKMGLAMQSGGNSGMEAQSFGAIAGGIVMVAAPQLVLLFT